MLTDSQRRLLKLKRLFAEWKTRRQDGENPSLSDLVPDDLELRRTLADFIEDPYLAEQQFEALEAATADFDNPTTRSDENVADTVRNPISLPEIDGYSILGEIDSGGMGVVYKALQLKLNRTVAIKMIHFARMHNSKEIVRFLGEAEAVAAIDHPNVVRVFDSGSANGTPYIAMEYLPGGSLSDRLTKHGRMDPRFAAQLIRKIAMGVQAAHDQQIVHRDLKPGNVLFDADGEPRITDFGLAKKRYSGDLTSTQSVMGTPEYMAPEQARGESKYVGPQADIWALGVIFYEMLTGKRPFSASNKMEAIRLITQFEQPNMRTIARHVPLTLELIVAKCLEKEPESRYKSARTFARDLKKWLTGKEIGLTPATPTEKVLNYIEKHKYYAILITQTLIILFCLYIIINLKSHNRDSQSAPDGRGILTERKVE